MSNQRLAVTIGIASICSALIAITTILRLPEQVLKAIDTIPIKAILVALAVVISAWIGVVVFRLLYVPRLRKFCVHLGSTIVGTALLCSTLPYGVLAMESARLKYVESEGNGGMNRDATANIKISSSSAVITSCITIVVAAIAGLGFTALYFRIAVYEQLHGSLN
jgi:hypothetical protein